MNQHTKQATVVSSSVPSPNKFTDKISLFNDDGSPFSGNNLPLAPVTTGSAIGTVGKSTSDSEPLANSLVPIKFTNGNTAAAPTMAFDGGTARAIRLGGSTPTGAELTLAANGVAMFWFDGTILHQLGVYA